MVRLRILDILNCPIGNLFEKTENAENKGLLQNR